MLRRTFAVGLLFAVRLLAADGPLATGVDAIGLIVSNLDRSVAFYSTVLGFEKVSEIEAEGTEIEHLTGVFGAHIRQARLRLGGEFIELTEYLAPEGRPLPVDAHSNDRWFQHIAIIVSDMDRAYQLLRQHRVRHISPSPQRLPDWNKNAGGIRAFYFRDPDGHPLEILSFPEGKGDPKWHAAKNQLFLGIDHTAIAVTDTEKSLRFYRDLLGLRVAGTSENYGIEQERLNSVFGAHLRITALRGPEGPGIELLEYLSPADGRPYPIEAKSNDLSHWQTRFRTSAAAEAATTLRNFRAPFVSTGAVTLPRAVYPFRQSVIVRDPDGHAVELAAR